MARRLLGGCLKKAAERQPSRGARASGRGDKGLTRQEQGERLTGQQDGGELAVWRLQRGLEVGQVALPAAQVLPTQLARAVLLMAIMAVLHKTIAGVR